MPRTIEVQLFKYEELSEKAKEKAREWWRSDELGYEWWDGAYEDAMNVGKLLGFDIKDINFSGFWSQGDGARFSGSWRAADVDAEALRKECPQDEELHKLAAALEEVAKRNPEASMVIIYFGRYEYSGCTNFDQDFPFGDDDATNEENEAAGKRADDDFETARDSARSLMDWIYVQLEKEHEYLMSDEQVAETICSNEYEFHEDGSIS